MSEISTVAIVGAGLVGQGWAIVHARAGKTVHIFDALGDAEARIRPRIMAALTEMQQAGLCDAPDEWLARISFSATLEDAVGRSDFVQESTFERIDVKHEISAAIDAALPAHACVGSSTSGFPGSAFLEECTNRARMLVLHPVNPPHLVPIVEIVPTPWTDPEIAARVRVLMEEVGQSPVSLNHEIPGFVLNRLQGALLDEAFALLEDGLASAEDIDRTIRDGLGLRWAFMGPFETIDLNAPKGLADYAERLGPMYAGFARQRRADRDWQPSAVQRAHAERRALLPEAGIDHRRSWRDRMLMAILRAKQDNRPTELPMNRKY